MKIYFTYEYLWVPSMPRWTPPSHTPSWHKKEYTVPPEDIEALSSLQLFTKYHLKLAYILEYQEDMIIEYSPNYGYEFYSELYITVA